MKVFESLLLALMLTAAPLTVLAHGTDQHVVGTITAIDAQHLEVKTPKGGSVTVKLTGDTRFLAKGAKGPQVRPEVGDRVVIDVMTEGTEVTATEVQYASPKPKSR